MLHSTCGQFLSLNGVSVPTVQRRLQQVGLAHVEAPQLKQVQDVHGFLQRQQHLGAISSAVAVIEALPETLLCPVDPQLRALFGALKARGFAQPHLTAVLTNCAPGSALALLSLPGAEVAPRLDHLAALLALPAERMPGLVSRLPGLLSTPPAQLAASAAWLAASLRWSAASLRRHSELLLRPAGKLEEAAVLLQSRLDLSTAELVLMLHIVPHLLAASQGELEQLVSPGPSAVELARAASAPIPQQNEYAAQSHHLKLCMLKLCSAHGLTLADLDTLLRDKPTVLREVKL